MRLKYIKYKFNLYWIVILVVVLFSQEQALGQERLNDKLINFTEKVLPFKDIVARVEAQSEVVCVYSSNYIEPDKLIYLEKDKYFLNDLGERIQQQMGCLVFYRENRMIFTSNTLYAESTMKNRSISGFVRDGESMEALIGAAVWIDVPLIGTYTDFNGFFHIKIPEDRPDTLSLHFSFVGYKEFVLHWADTVALQSEFLLFKDASISQVLISGQLSMVNGVLDTTKIFDAQGVQFLPGSLGGSDLFRELSLLPGINRSNDFQPGVSIRGFPPANTAYLLDGLPVYEPNHAFGLYSAINHESVAAVRLYKNYIPLNFPGRTSGLVQHELKQGNANTLKRKLHLSLEDIGLRLEGPIIQHKTSFGLSTRKSVFGLYLPDFLARNTDLESGKMNYGDIDFKVHHAINATNSLQLVGFYSKDKYSFGRNNGRFTIHNSLDWSNQVLGLKWKGITNSSIHTFQLGISRYSGNKQLSIQSADPQNSPMYFDQLEQASLTDLILNQTNTHYTSESTKIQWGFSVFRHYIKPVLYRSVLSDSPLEQPVLETGSDTLSWDVTTYVNIHWNPAQRLIIEPGLQLNGMQSLQGKRFVRLNPVLRSNILLGSFGQLEAIVQRSHQNVHLLNQQSVGLVSQLWFQANSVLPPQDMWQASLNYSQGFRQKLILSAEIYGRKYSNLAGFISPTDLYDPSLSDGTVIPVFNDPANWEKKVTRMNGTGWGIEFLVDWVHGPVSLSGSYAFGKTDLIDENGGPSFPSANDFRHAFHVFAQLRFNETWVVYFNWQYHSGGTYTFPNEYFIIDDEQILSFSGKNNQRFEPYHIANAGLKHRGRIKNFPVEIDIGLRNIYARKNPVYVYISNSGESLSARQFNGLPLYPTARLSIEF